MTTIRTANGVSIIKDDLPKVLSDIADLVKKQVLIGIPDSATDRGGNEPTNALIGYVMETGSPANNVPARPHLVPGVQNAEPQIIPQLKAAAGAALDGDKTKMAQHLNSAGLIGSASVKREIMSGNFVPLKPATIAARHRQRGAQKRSKSEEAYLQLLKQGSSPAAAQAAVGIQPLVNSGEYRNSITYVVRDK